MDVILALDLGGTKVNYAVVTTDGSILLQHRMLLKGLGGADLVTR